MDKKKTCSLLVIIMLSFAFGFVTAKEIQKPPHRNNIIELTKEQFQVLKAINYTNINFADYELSDGRYQRCIYRTVHGKRFLVKCGYFDNYSVQDFDRWQKEELLKTIHRKGKLLITKTVKAKGNTTIIAK